MKQNGRVSRLEANRAVSAVREFIEQQISLKAWPPGDRLPTERDLADQFDVGRNAVRRALAELEESGKIFRHVGRGTFVREANGAGRHIGADIRSVNPAEVMEVRLLIEPALADLIVTRASQLELEELQTLVNQGGTSRNMAEFEMWDTKLHNALVRASKNEFLTQILADVHAVRQKTAWGKLKRRGMNEDRLRAYQLEHQAIVTALLDRDADAAREAIRSHLRHVRHNLTEV